MNIKTAAIAVWLVVANNVEAQQLLRTLDQTPSRNNEASGSGGIVPPVAQGFDQSVIVQRYGKIIGRKPLGVGGLTAWTVEKKGRKLVLYTTADGQAIFTGIVWDALTGKNMSDALLTKPPIKEGAVKATPLIPQNVSDGIQAGVRIPAMQGAFTGAIPESIKTVNSLAGIKEGQGSLADTVYIIIDPRCPYCRKAYNATRAYVKKGFSIKWIPTLALGDPASGLPLAATLLQSKSSDVWARVLGAHESIKTQPTKETEESLSLSLSFMQAAFEQNKGGQAGVPVAFYLDHRTGKPKMITGISEVPVLEELFGKI